MQIVLIEPVEKKNVLALYRTVTRHLRDNGIHQWDRFYPNGIVVGQDMKGGHVYGMVQDNSVIGAVVVNDEQSTRYQSVDWEDKSGDPACIHRLAVHPQFQGNGVGKLLLQYAERHAADQGHTSIRLDVYCGNPTAVGMYERAGYHARGEIRFPFRKLPYLCYEKELADANEAR